jgi:hypothetical protein
LRRDRKEDFIRILTEPENNMIKQQKALLATEGVELDFSDDAIHEARTRPAPARACGGAASARRPTRGAAAGRARGRGGQQLGGQHRRAAAAHGAGAHPGGDFVRGARAGALARRSHTAAARECAPHQGRTRRADGGREARQVREAAESGSEGRVRMAVTKELVAERVGELLKRQDLSKYVL